MGSYGASLAFAFSGGKSKTKPDATTRALNEFRLKQAESLLGDFGPSIGRIREIGTPSRGTRSYLDSLSKVASERGLQSDSWYRQAVRNTNEAYGNNLAYISDTIAPSLVSAGNSYYNQILRPEIANNAALLGLSRSGAQIEAQAKGAASIALPISQTIAGLQGQQLQGRANAITGFSSQLPQVDIDTRNSYLQRLGLGVNAKDYTRQQRLSAEETYSNFLTSFINATPYTAGSTTKYNNWSVQGSASASYGTGGGGAGGQANSSFFNNTGSDINFKENLAPFDSKEFLSQLVPYSYNYKPSYPHEDSCKRTAGIIAQQLEQTEYGSMLVETREDGKYINYTQALSVMMACLVDMNTRLARLGV